MQTFDEKSDVNVFRVLLAALATCILALTTSSAWAGDKNPYTRADETWITLNGTVESVAPDTFTLDYGDGMIVVEMDDGDRDADAYKLLKGDKVIVTGKIDDDFFQATSIEASSVYVENIGTTFFSSSVDEEDADIIAAELTLPIVATRFSVQGTVTKIDGDDFIIDNGAREIRVDVSSLSYDPLDDEGYQQIEVGDRVKVYGYLDTDLFEGREIQADTLIELYNRNFS